MGFKLMMTNNKTFSRISTIHLKWMVCLTILLSLLLVSGCGSISDTEGKTLPDDTDVLTAQNAEKENKTDAVTSHAMTYEIFSEHAAQCTDQLQDDTIISLEFVQSLSPDLYEEIIRNPAQISLFCFTDLVDQDTNTLVLDPKPVQPPPKDLEKFECGLVQCMMEKFDDLSDFDPGDTEGEPFQWLALYHRYALETFRENEFQIDASFYAAHPIQRQYMVSILREPSWRMMSATPFIGELYDQEVYFDGINQIADYLKTGNSSEQISVQTQQPEPFDICTEDTTWELSQQEDLSVTLAVHADTNEMTITYTP